MRARSQAREAALKALYQVDLRPDLTAAEMEEVLRAEAKNDEVLAFARELVEGTRAHLADIDREVESTAHNWNLKRMAVIDRNVIRMGTFELLHRPDVPPAVAINEAVVMAKKYSTKDSGSFVNGILDKIHQRHHGPDRGGAGAARKPKVRPESGGEA
jgi:transcription antitermination factor NusB